jgi:hypothetical protein
MGVSISMKVGSKWVSITPGWRSQMAAWLQEIGGYREILVFTEADLPALEERKAKQRIGEEDPPFDRSDEWTKCFDQIIDRIKQDQEAMVRLSY